MILRRPRLLVSVRSAHEAEEALAGGADWVDLKEPHRGALGAVDGGVAREVVALVDGRAPLSAAAGELRDWPMSASRELSKIAGIKLLKLGLAGLRGADWRGVWRLAFDQIAEHGKQLVAVIYADAAAADAPPVDEQFAAAVYGPAAWVLWDTFDKSGVAITEHLGHTALGTQLEVAKGAGKRTVVAGKLRAASIARLPWEHIDMIAVRGAACNGPRDARICRRRVAELSQLIKRHADCYIR